MPPTRDDLYRAAKTALDHSHALTLVYVETGYIADYEVCSAASRETERAIDALHANRDEVTP